MPSVLVFLLSSYLLPAATPEIQSPSTVEADTLVVCAPALRAALQPWVDYRVGQGHRLEVLTQYDSPQSIRAAIRRAAEGGGLRFLVLVGDIQHHPAGARLQVPTYLAEAKVNRRWGSEAEIATDNWFADLDDDLLPDLAVGRIPVDSPDQLAAVVRKIIDYEQSSSAGIWRRRVNLIAGVGGFGMLVDTVLESATRSMISRGIPEGYRTSMTYASWRSPYCPDPRAFRQQTIERMNEGCLCWVYIGHGQRQGLDWVRVPTGVAPIMDLDDVEQVACAPGPPIALLLSCYGAAFDGSEDCLGERLLARPAGPIAVIGGTRVTMPYGMAVLSQRLMRQMFEEHATTLGQMLLEAKRQTLAPPGDSTQTPWLDALARAFSQKPDDLLDERREHVLMFHLLGDPLTRIRHAQPLEVDVPRVARAGQPLLVKCRCQVSGVCTVELTCRRGRLTFKPDARREFDGTHAGMQQLTRVYLRANDDRFASQQLQASTPEFTATLAVPQDVSGPCAVRVFVQGAEAFALGAAALYVAGPQPGNHEGGEAAQDVADAASPIANSP